MCTALAAGHADPQLTPSACGIWLLSLQLYSLYLPVFISVLVGEYVTGPWMLGGHTTPKAYAEEMPGATGVPGVWSCVP